MFNRESVDQLQRVRAMAGLKPLSTAEVDAMWDREWGTRHQQLLNALRHDPAVVASQTVNLATVEKFARTPHDLTEQQVADLESLCLRIAEVIRKDPRATRKSMEPAVKRTLREWSEKELPAELHETFDRRYLESYVRATLDKAFGEAREDDQPAKPSAGLEPAAQTPGPVLFST